MNHSTHYGSDKQVNGVLFSPDGNTLFASGLNNKISSWNSYCGTLSQRQFNNFYHVNKKLKPIQMACTLDNILFHPSDDGSVFGYSVQSGELIAHLKGHLDATFAVGLDEAKDRILTASFKDGVYAWDIDDRPPITHALIDDDAIDVWD